MAAAIAAGANSVGFVITDSVRQVSIDQARRLIADVPADVLSVGVFSGIPAAEAGRLALAAGAGAVQLHGDYPRAAFNELADLPVRLIRATTLTPATEVRAGAWGEDMLLLDSAVAGSGEKWDWSLLDSARPSGSWLLAGGLRPGNVAAAIAAARPWGVDVSSGVESRRGVKDDGLIREFVAATREAPVAGS